MASGNAFLSRRGKTLLGRECWIDDWVVREKSLRGDGYINSSIPALFQAIALNSIAFLPLSNQPIEYSGNSKLIPQLPWLKFTDRHRFHRC